MSHDKTTPRQILFNLGLNMFYTSANMRCFGLTRLIGFAMSAYLSQNMEEEAALVFEEAIGRCGKGSFFGVREKFMMHFLEKGQLDGALSHLEAVLSEVKEIKWHFSPKVVSAFLKYYEEKTNLDGVDELCKIFKTHNLDDSWLKTCIPASG